jgi:hypothetical protein
VLIANPYVKNEFPGTVTHFLWGLTRTSCFKNLPESYIFHHQRNLEAYGLSSFQHYCSWIGLDSLLCEEINFDLFIYYLFIFWNLIDTLPIALVVLILNCRHPWPWRCCTFSCCCRVFPPLLVCRADQCMGPSPESWDFPIPAGNCGPVNSDVHMLDRHVHILYKPGASSPGVKQYGDWPTNGPTDGTTDAPTDGRMKSFIEVLVRV